MKFKTTYNYVLLSPLLVEFFLIIPSIPPETKTDYISLTIAALLFVGVIWLFNKTNIKNSIVMKEKVLFIPYDLNANEIGIIPYAMITDIEQDPAKAGKRGIVITFIKDYSQRQVIIRVRNDKMFIDELTKRSNKLRNK